MDFCVPEVHGREVPAGLFISKSAMFSLGNLQKADFWLLVQCTRWAWRVHCWDNGISSCQSFVPRLAVMGWKYFEPQNEGNDQVLWEVVESSGQRHKIYRALQFGSFVLNVGEGGSGGASAWGRRIWSGGTIQERNSRESSGVGYTSLHASCGYIWADAMRLHHLEHEGCGGRNEFVGAGRVRGPYFII